MRITDFELQSQSGQLWPDIVERMAEKDTQITGLSTQIGQALATIEQGKKLIASGDHAALLTLVAEAAKSEKQRAIESAELEVKAAQERLNALKG